MLGDQMANERRAPAVKICGLTNLEDARHAWRAGADLLGFVLVPGTPRYIAPEDAAALVRALRAEGCDASMVGVLAYEPPGGGAHRRARPTAPCDSRFAPEASPPATVAAVARACGFGLLQLHGDPSPDDVAALGVPALIAMRVRGAIDWDALGACRAWGYVLDGFDPHRLGGTGKGWDWTLAADRPEALGRVIVAGGLTPDNVAEAIRLARPWGVDVSSGVEAAPGRKDPARVKRFIERAKGV